MTKILIGPKGTKRESFFLKAAEELLEEVVSLDYDELFKLSQYKNPVVKIDPPISGSDQISRITPLGEEYIEFLQKLKDMPGIRFLNTPSSIINTFHKGNCKRVLEQAGIPVTPMLGSSFSCHKDLKVHMLDRRERQVFIKPTFGSGAAGVAAYRLHPGTKKEMLYTSVSISGGQLVNTKKLCCIQNPQQIESIVNFLLSDPAVVERWIPKDNIMGQGYDLRVVYQFGRIDYIVARLSKGPITNLHLNNHAEEVSIIGLDKAGFEEIEELCRSAVDLFPGLLSAGIDILLTRNRRTPKIIEINGQGDLLYKDIYDKNQIYKNQIRRMGE